MSGKRCKGEDELPARQISSWEPEEARIQAILRHTNRSPLTSLHGITRASSFSWDPFFYLFYYYYLTSKVGLQCDEPMTCVHSSLSG